VNSGFDSMIACHEGNQAETLSLLKDSFSIVLKLAMNKLASQNKTLREKLKKADIGSGDEQSRDSKVDSKTAKLTKQLEQANKEKKLLLQLISQ